MTTPTGFALVRKLGLALPGVEESTSYGEPSLKVGGAMFASMTSHSSAEPNSLAIRMTFEQRDELIAAAPDTYYLTPHYVGYPCVVVRLHRVSPDALRDLLSMGWRFVSAKHARNTRRKYR